MTKKKVKVRPPRVVWDGKRGYYVLVVGKKRVKLTDRQLKGLTAPAQSQSQVVKIINKVGYRPRRRAKKSGVRKDFSIYLPKFAEVKFQALNELDALQRKLRQLKLVETPATNGRIPAERFAGPAKVADFEEPVKPAKVEKIEEPAKPEVKEKVSIRRGTLRTADDRSLTLIQTRIGLEKLRRKQVAERAKAAAERAADDQEEKHLEEFKPSPAPRRKSKKLVERPPSPPPSPESSPPASPRRSDRKRKQNEFYSPRGGGAGTCPATLKGGKKKGAVCGSKHIDETGFCRFHGHRLNTALYDNELIRLLAPYHEFAGVCMLDECEDLMRKRLDDGDSRFGFVANTAKTTDKGGKHWVGVYVDLDDGKQICYYDSFGERMPLLLLEAINNTIEHAGRPWLVKLKANKLVHQTLKSQRCGYHVARFLVTMFKGGSFRDATEFGVVAGEKSAAEMEKDYSRFGYV